MKTLTTAFLVLLGAADAQENQQVTLRFDAMAGEVPAVCGTVLPGLGAQSTPIRLQDFRLFVSGVRLLTSGGEEVPVALEQDGLWQHQNAALLDFEDATGACAEVGTAETNAQVVGTAPAGDYTGVAFTLGLPFELNHVDASSAPSPLNLTAMYWSWQGGYKFVRLELLNAGTGTQYVPTARAVRGNGHGSAAPAGFWPIHLGSFGCTSPAAVVPPQEMCANPNRAEVRLEGFDVDDDVIVADLATLLRGVDVSRSLQMAPPGCMSVTDDPDCARLFPNLGLELSTGEPAATQTFFRAAARGE